MGGPAYLTALINNVPTSLHAVAYAKLVEEAATRRRLLGAANDIARLAYAADTPVEEVINDAEKALFGVSERRLTHELAPIRLVLSEFYDRIDYLARHRDETIGVPTGFIDLDRLLGGMQPSDLLIIAGRPGQGKSGFCLSAAKNAAQIHKKHVALFSLEMSNEQLVQRLLAQETAIEFAAPAPGRSPRPGLAPFHPGRQRPERDPDLPGRHRRPSRRCSSTPSAGDCTWRSAWTWSSSTTFSL